MLDHKILARPWFRGLLLAAAGVALVGGLGRLAGQAGRSAAGELPVRLVAYQPERPSLEGGVGWINTSGPIHLDALRGKVVLLDFWTYCCINCHHILPDLAYLEEKYKDDLVVIGVHSAKFDAERDTDNIRKKVAEYRIKHPVVNDADMKIWNRFGVQSWPTLVVIDARGNVVGAVSGEGHRALLDQAIGKLIAQHKARGEMSATPIRFFPESEKPHKGGLLYPGKVTADAEGKRLFISDTGHNRIVITDLEGQHATVVGNGLEGFTDGSYDKARFNRPQGTCLVGETLYVADTENHAIRAINLADKQVTTVAGTGKQSHAAVRRGDPLHTGLNSPWDVLLLPGTRTLAIAMAGQHQVWRLDLSANTVGVWAGSGVENILDGPPGSAAFAQPSGLATDGQNLYVADSEVSGIRSIPIGKASTHTVRTVVGVGLFGFADVDGRGSAVRLQHCLGVAYGGGKLYIADTYNNKVKVCEPETRSVQTFVGTHEPGFKDDPPMFDEPGGLSLAGDTLFVADTNNHAIRTVSLSSRNVGTLKLDVKPPVREPRRPSFPNPMALTAPSVELAPGKELKLDVALTLPEGFKMNPDAPMHCLVESPSDPAALASGAPTAGARVEPPASEFSVSVPLARATAAGQSLTLKVEVAAYVCRTGSEGVCTVKSYVWTLPVSFTEGGAARVTLTNLKPFAAPAR